MNTYTYLKIIKLPPQNKYKTVGYITKDILEKYNVMRLYFIVDNFVKKYSMFDIIANSQRYLQQTKMKNKSHKLKLL